MSDAEVNPSGNSNHDSLCDNLPGNLAASQLGDMLEAEKNYLLAIATEELGQYLQSKGGASDLVQETFLHATRDYLQFAGRTREEFRGWLRSILRHSLLNFRRQYLDTAKREAGREVPLAVTQQAGFLSETFQAPIPSPSRVVMRAELMATIQAAIQALSPQHQEIIELRSVQQLPFEEIARRIGRSADASRKLWCRAIEALQAELLSQNHDLSGLN